MEEKMLKEEMICYCSEEKILLDNGLSDFFLSMNSLNFVKSFLGKVKAYSHKNFITFELIVSLKNQLLIFLKLLENEFPEDIQRIYDKFNFSKEKTFQKKEFINPSFSNVKVLSGYSGEGKIMEVKDFVNLFRARYTEFKKILENSPELEGLVAINKISNDKQKISIIGMISSKSVTKNQNLVLEVEDFTGKIKIIFSKEKEELYSLAEDAALDSVLGFSGFGNKEILFANKLIFPEVFLDGGRKKSPLEEYALFLGDVHFGSKNFLEKDFLKFINYLNGNNVEDSEVKKIKYLFIVGDLITGIGNYPNQEKDLKLVDLEAQFERVASFLSKIRKDIKIIITPGNHDCVRLMEPQPILNEKFAWPIYELENVIVAENPSMINIGAMQDFEGFNVLVYHGFSFPYYANNIPSLMKERVMNSPEKIMKYLLLHRHLAPTHGSVQYFPSPKDYHLISKVPDFFVSGHTHKSGVNYVKDVLLISVSSWESMTPYQEKFGNTPDHCKVPMINLKTRAVKILDFETKGEVNGH
jgi:DNA polymerase II small subunit